jgi:hypothetical protein
MANTNARIRASAIRTRREIQSVDSRAADAEVWRLQWYVKHKSKWLINDAQRASSVQITAADFVTSGDTEVMVSRKLTQKFVSTSTSNIEDTPSSKRTCKTHHKEKSLIKTKQCFLHAKGTPT